MMSRPVLAIIAGLALAGVCAWIYVSNRPPQARVNAPQDAGDDQDLPPIPRLGAAPEFELVDQAGNTWRSSQLEGKAWICNFMFTRCMATCPQQSRALERIQITLKDLPVYDSVRLVSVTVDPEHDTPEVLRDYAGSYNADLDHWKFLTGEKETIWDLSRNGFHLPVSDNPDDPLMPIGHDSRLILVDRLGQVRGHFDSTTEESLEELLAALDVVLGEFDPGVEMAQVEALGVDTDYTHVMEPQTLVEDDWLDERQAQQLAAADAIPVLHDFLFRDEREASGITFFPQIVDEQRFRREVNHYDHGNGLAVADVDGDGLLDLYFVAQVGPNELWHNLGGGRFENVTDEAGVGLAEQIKVTASFADVDNDGDADLYVTSLRANNVLFLNDGEGSFTDVTADWGVDYSGHSSSALFFDYDRDGFLDMFLCNVGKFTTDELLPVWRDAAMHAPPGEYEYFAAIPGAFGGHLNPELDEPSLLFRNVDGQRYEDVTDELGLDCRGWNGDAVALDANDDGWLDLYVLNMQGRDAYYENQAGSGFVLKTDELFSQTPWGAMGAKVFDFDGDQRFDLYVTDMHSDMSENVGPEREKLKSRMQWPAEFLSTGDDCLYGNALYVSQEDGGFREVSDDVGAENYWPWGLSVGDLNADGWDDAFITASMCFPFRYGVNSVLLNSGGMFHDSEFVLGIEPRLNRQTIQPWFALDASGADAEHPNSRGRSGDVLVWSSIGSRSSALLDLDADGDLDIVTNEFNTPPMVLISDLTERHPETQHLSIVLQGSGTSNRDALGAVVTLVCGERSITKLHDGKSGYLSQSRMPLYFGIPDGSNVERIDIVWPSGREQTIAGPIELNQQMLIVEE